LVIAAHRGARRSADLHPDRTNGVERARLGAASSRLADARDRPGPPSSAAALVVHDRTERTMWWGIGLGGAILYLILLFVLGFKTLRKGHWVMFIVGIFLPVFWLIGALIGPSRSAAATSS
jgi:hypothetical protein